MYYNNNTKLIIGQFSDELKEKINTFNYNISKYTWKELSDDLFIIYINMMPIYEYIIDLLMKDSSVLTRGEFYIWYEFTHYVGVSLKIRDDDPIALVNSHKTVATFLKSEKAPFIEYYMAAIHSMMDLLDVVKVQKKETKSIWPYFFLQFGFALMMSMKKVQIKYLKRKVTEIIPIHEMDESLYSYDIEDELEHTNTIPTYNGFIGMGLRTNLKQYDMYMAYLLSLGYDKNSIARRLFKHKDDFEEYVKKKKYGAYIVMRKELKENE